MCGLARRTLFFIASKYSCHTSPVLVDFDHIFYFCEGENLGVDDFGPLKHHLGTYCQYGMKCSLALFREMREIEYSAATLEFG